MSTALLNIFDRYEAEIHELMIPFVADGMKRRIDKDFVKGIIRYYELLFPRVIFSYKGDVLYTFESEKMLDDDLNSYDEQVQKSIQSKQRYPESPSALASQLKDRVEALRQKILSSNDI